jgi:hypothetical protein
MPNSRMPAPLSVRRAIFAIGVSLGTVLLPAANRALAGPRSESLSGLLITPSAVVLLAGETSSLSAIDGTGRPVANVHWSISPPIADLREENGAVFLEGKQPGRAVLTASAGTRDATAVVSVVAGSKLPPGTVRWSLQPLPGFQTLMVMPAVPTGDAPRVLFHRVE